MPWMQRLLNLQTTRDARQLTRLVLVWFVLSLGAAIASPLVNPQSSELICTGTGVMKVLVKNADGIADEGGTELASRMLDCPLCATVSAPPPMAKMAALPTRPLLHVLPSIPAERHIARTAAPLMAHAPPVFS